MSDIAKEVLRHFRIFGPCSNAAIARRIGISPDKCYRVVSEIEQRGLLIHLNQAKWDISELGRDWIIENGVKELTLFPE